MRTMSAIVEEIGTLEALRALAPEWERLWKKTGATPFQTPQWLIPWWEHFGSGKLRVLTVREGGGGRGELTALLPLVQRGEELHFLGTGVTDWLDGLFESASASHQLFRALCAARDWQRCDLRQLPRHSHLLEAPLAEGFTGRLEIAEVCPCLELPGKAERRLLELEYYKRRARRCCQSEFIEADARNVDQLMEALFRLHSLRWRALGLEGMFADAPVRAFHRQVARGFCRKKCLNLFGLKFGQRIVGCYYGFFAKGAAYYYLSGFDPEFKVFSPGTMVVGHAIERAMAEGARRFDFLRGQEPYKYLWGAGDRVAYRRWMERV